MSTAPTPVVSQDSTVTAPQSGLQRFLSFLGTALTAVRPVAAQLAAVGGEPGPLEQLNKEKEFGFQQQDLADRRAMLQSQLQTQALERQRATQEMNNYQSPEQRQQMDLDTLRKTLGIQRDNSEPQLLPIPQQDGSIKYYQRKYNSATNDWDITPAEASMQEIVSSPDNPQVPWDPSRTVTRAKLAPLTAANPKVFENQLDLSRQIAFATDPRVQQGKIDVARAEGQARANVEAGAARGSNAALANVPPHLIAPATEAATKAGTDYAQSKSVSDRLAAMMQAARNGNVVSYQLIPQEGILQVTTSQGVHRINMAEIENYSGGGSLWQRLVGHVGKQLSGQSIPPSVLDDMSDIQNFLAQGARSKYENSLKTINQYYGSNFQPVEMGGLTSTGNRPPLSSFEH